MKRGCLILLALPVIVAYGAWVGWRWAYPTYMVRYRLTVNAVAGGVPHSGSSVVEMRIVTQPHWLLAIPPWKFNVTGEATFVDLGYGRNLVAMLGYKPARTAGSYFDLGGAPYYYHVFNAFDVPVVAEHAQDLTSLRGERPLKHKDWPPFATFCDVQDPFSVQSIDAKASPMTLGNDVRIDSVTVTITQEPATRSLAEKLPWLAELGEGSRIYPVNNANPEISQGSLVQEDPS
jgi:hypothetical protein